jgi:hypothetical protein
VQRRSANVTQTRALHRSAPTFIGGALRALANASIPFLIETRPEKHDASFLAKKEVDALPTDWLKKAHEN